MLDNVILLTYILIAMTTTGKRFKMCILVAAWMGVSTVIGHHGYPASFAFPAYWVLAVCLCIGCVKYESRHIFWGASAMLILQTLMIIDHILSSDPNSSMRVMYSALSTVIHLFIIVSTYLHGRGVDDGFLADCRHHRHTRHRNS